MGPAATPSSSIRTYTQALRGFAVLLLACVLVHEGAHASAPLDVSDFPECISDPEGSCCAARKAWRTIEARGGCGGGGSSEQDGDDCKVAERLCRECQYGGGLSIANSTKANLMYVNLSGVEGAALDTLAPGSLEMRCAPPSTTGSCLHAMADVGIIVVFIAGTLLLLLCGGGATLFDWYAVPWLVHWRSQAWSSPDHMQSHPMDSLDVEAVPPPAQTSPGHIIRPPEAPPPPFAGAHGVHMARSVESLRSAAATFDRNSFPYLVSDPPSEAQSASLRSEQQQFHAQPHQTTTANTEDNLAGSGVMLAGRSRPVPLELPKSSASRSGSGAGWSLRISRVWALRSIFFLVAIVAAILRVMHTILCSILAMGVEQTSLAIELLACVVPVIWCAVLSQPPADPEVGMPNRAPYTCCRMPRFLVFSALAVIMEMYSTTVAAWGLAATSCDVPASQTIQLYCLGVVAAVARSYSALLALRLQDELMGVCRRVVPCLQEDSPTEDVKKASTSPVVAAHIQCEIKLDPSLDTCDIDAGPEVICGLGKGVAASLCASSPGGHCTGIGSLEKVLALKHLELPEAPPEQPAGAELHPACSCLRSLRCKGGQRQLPGRRFLIRIGLLIVVLSAAASAWFIYSVASKKASKPKLPSACATAQNATATCELFETVGGGLWDDDRRDAVMSLANTMEDCCRGCDEVAGCQGWMFESTARRCRWVRFLEAPCKNNPGDLQCRCLTHFGTAFGFKPTSPIVWLQRGSGR